MQMNDREIQELKDLTEKLGELVPAFDWSADADDASELQLAIQQSAEMLRTGGFSAERIQLMTSVCLRLEKEKGRPVLITDSEQNQISEAVRKWLEEKKVLSRTLLDSRFVRQLVRQYFTPADFRKVKKKIVMEKAASMTGALTQLVYSNTLCRDNDFSGTRKVVENWLEAHPDQTRKYFCTLCLVSAPPGRSANELMVLPIYVLAVWIMADTCLDAQEAADAVNMCQRVLDLWLADPEPCIRILADIQIRAASIFQRNVNIALQKTKQKQKPKQAQTPSLPKAASSDGLAIRRTPDFDPSSVSSRKEHSNPAGSRDDDGPLDETELRTLSDALISGIAADAPSACRMIRQTLEHTIRDIPRAILFEEAFKKRERAAAAGSFERLICGSDGFFEIYCRILSGYTCSQSLCHMHVFPSLLELEPASLFSRSLAGPISGQKFRPLYPDIEAEAGGFNFLAEQLAVHLLYSSLWKGEISRPLLTLMESIEPQLSRLDVPRFLDQDLRPLAPMEKRMKKLTASLLLHSQAVSGFACRLMKMLSLDLASFPKWSAEVFEDFEENSLETGENLHRAAIHFILLWINQEYEVCFFSPFMMFAKNAFDHYHTAAEKLTNCAEQTVMIALADEISKARKRLLTDPRSALFYDQDLCRTFENIPVNGDIVPFSVSESNPKKNSKEDDVLQAQILNDFFQLMAAPNPQVNKAVEAVRLLSPFVSPVFVSQQLDDLVCTHFPLVTGWLENWGLKLKKIIFRCLVKIHHKKTEFLLFPFCLSTPLNKKELPLMAQKQICQKREKMKIKILKRHPAHQRLRQSGIQSRLTNPYWKTKRSFRLFKTVLASLKMNWNRQKDPRRRRIETDATAPTAN